MSNTPCSTLQKQSLLRFLKKNGPLRYNKIDVLMYRITSILIHKGYINLKNGVLHYVKDFS